MSSVKMQAHANVKRRNFPPTFLPLPPSLSVYYPDVPTRTTLELPAAKDKSYEKGAAMSAAEADSAYPVESVAVPTAMKNRPLPDIPKEAVSKLYLVSSENASIQTALLNAEACAKNELRLAWQMYGHSPATHFLLDLPFLP